MTEPSRELKTFEDKRNEQLSTMEFQDVLAFAKVQVQWSPLYKKFIDGTPLANDIPVWMAEFALKYRQAALSHRITELEAQLDAIKRAVSSQTETIASWLPKNGEFDELKIDSDKIEAWVNRLREIADGAPDKTALEEAQDSHLETINQYNELVDELAAERKLGDEMAKRFKKLLEWTVVSSPEHGEVIDDAEQALAHYSEERGK